MASSGGRAEHRKTVGEAVSARGGTGSRPHAARARSGRPLSGIDREGYSCDMTKLLQRALEAVQRLPVDSQDEIARAMLELAGEGGEPEEIDPAHLQDVLESLAQARRREFASDKEIEAAFRRFER